jgi:hypothetical protein
MDSATLTTDNVNARQAGEELTVSFLVLFPALSTDLRALLTSHVECDSLADGDQRRLREEGKPCECKEGWGGINCNGDHSLPERCTIMNILIY